jgi:hypothetical protein
MSNLVLLCDRDHGLVHELDLVMTRTGRRLVVTAPDGRRVWGSADAAFAAGLSGLGAPSASEQEHVAGVHPIDTVVGRRPAPPAGAAATEARPQEHRLVAPGGRPPRRTRAPAGPARGGLSVAPGRPGATRARRRGSLRPQGAAPSPSLPRPDVPFGTTLFPDGEPPLPAAMPAGGERMDVRYVVGVLMGNRDLVRRLAAEATGVPAGTP